MPLDSQNGERITGIDTWYDDLECVFAITVSISFPNGAIVALLNSIQVPYQL